MNDHERQLNLPGVKPLENIFEQTLEMIGQGQKAPTSSPEATIREALELMKSTKSGCVIVMKDDKVEGVFTERDYLLKIAGDESECFDQPIGKYMVKNPVTVSKQCNLQEALVYMRVGNFRTLIVVDDQDNFVNVITMKDIGFYVTDMAGFRN